MISRRNLLKVAAPVILVPSAALAITPGSGTRSTGASVNWSHPACRSLQFSTIQDGSVATTGAMFDIARKQKGAATGTTTGGVLPWMGNIITLATTNHYNFATRPPVVEQVATFWFIIQLTTLAACDVLHTSNNASTGIGVEVSGTGALILNLSGVQATTSTVLLSASIPYLVVISKSYTVMTVLSRRLDTGAIATQTTTTGTPTASNGTYAIGASSGANNACNASYAAFAYSNSFMPVQTMVNLSSDPWGPWRPGPGLPFEEMVSGGTAATGLPRLISVP